jgi:hypothetical protein
MDLPILYSEKQVAMLMESAKTLLPVTTAYLALAAATAKYMFETQRVPLRRLVTGLTLIFAFGLSSLAAWIVSIAGIVDSARAFGLTPSAPVPNVAYLRDSWRLAVIGQQGAVIALFVSMLLYCAFLIYTFALAHRQAAIDDFDGE